MIKKFKPFSGFCPVPVLPSSQVAATSYIQHLAYLEWYIEQVRKHFEEQDADFDTAIEGIQDSFETVNADIEALDDRVAALEQSGGGGAAPALLRASGLVSSEASAAAGSIPLFGGISTTDKLTVDGTTGAIKIGAGVSKIRISGGMKVLYSGSARVIYCSVTRGAGGTAALVGSAYAPAGASDVVDLGLISDVITVSEGDLLYFNFSGCADLTNVTLTPSIVVEVIE